MLQLIIEINLLLIAFGACYFVFIKDGASFMASRLSLLLIPIMAILVPLLPISSLFQAIPQTTIFSFSMAEILVKPSGPEAAYHWHNLVIWAYVAGCVIFLLLFALRLYRIFRIVHYSKQERRQHYILVHTPGLTYAASFFNYLLKGDCRSLNPSEQKNIMAHEKAHIRYNHSWDVVFMEITRAIFWINPIAYVLKNELQLVHEYQADAAVNTNPEATTSYKRLLLKSALGSLHPTILNSIFHSNIKKRIIMLNKTKIMTRSILRGWLALPALALVVFAFSCSKNENLGQDQSEVQGSLLETEKIDRLPEFPGGKDAMYQYVGNSVKYPADAKAAGTTGTVVVKFIVDVDGKIKKARIANTVDDELAEEALRVINAMPEWKPALANGEHVAAEMVLPIKFAL
ncbi:MAG: M56 family metallopeptidase [Bacteroidia bacterium]